MLIFVERSRPQIASSESDETSFQSVSSKKNVKSDKMKKCCRFVKKKLKSEKTKKCLTFSHFLAKI